MATNFQDRIIVTEYPKSGGTWVTNLLGDCLGLPQKDIYVDNNFKLFDVQNHPWYDDSVDLNLPPACVIKSHELPDSKIANFPAQIIHVVRDGRDVVVSKYFYESDFCVKNGIIQSFDMTWGEFVRKTAAEWNTYVLAWLGTTHPWFRYEDLLDDTYGTLTKILQTLGRPVEEERVRAVIDANVVEKMRKSLSKTFTHNTFVRKAVAGDWKNHFSPDDLSAFCEFAGGAMALLGYSCNEKAASLSSGK